MIMVGQSKCINNKINHFWRDNSVTQDVIIEQTFLA